jgi:hypothetical protein
LCEAALGCRTRNLDAIASEGGVGFCETFAAQPKTYSYSLGTGGPMEEVDHVDRESIGW